MNRNFVLAIFPVVLACLSAAGNPFAQAGKAVAVSEALTATIETGRYEPQPDCKAGAGCGKPVWVASNRFAPGRRIWARVTIENRSDQAAVEYIEAELPSVRLEVVDQSMNSPASLTPDGCRMRGSSPCPQFRDDPKATPMILSGIGGLWVIAPHRSESTVLEITKQFAFPGAGRFSVTAENGDFHLTTLKDIASGVAADITAETSHLKTAGFVKSNTVEFTVAQ